MGRQGYGIKTFWRGYWLWLGGIAGGLLGSAIAPAPAFAQPPPAVLLEVEAPQAFQLPWPDPSFPFGQDEDYLPAVVPQATHLVLRLQERRLYVYTKEQVLASYPVAIGAPQTPTPTGEFKILQMVVDPVWENPWTGEVFDPGANSALGLRWIGFTELPSGVIGFHGTPTVESIGRAVSNGCVRLRNEDVVALFAQVQMGMTVIVEP